MREINYYIGEELGFSFSMILGFIFRIVPSIYLYLTNYHDHDPRTATEPDYCYKKTRYKMIKKYNKQCHASQSVSSRSVGGVNSKPSLSWVWYGHGRKVCSSHRGPGTAARYLTRHERLHDASWNRTVALPSLRKVVRSNCWCLTNTRVKHPTEAKLE